MTRRVVITGPESSGKSTLAQALARQLSTVVVPEFARTYLQYLHRPYTIDDLAVIHRGQLSWEAWYAQRAQKWLICDTDWTVMQIWKEHFAPQSNLYFERQPWHHAFLCRPDIPWEPDPLREHPHQREALFDEYLQLLESTGWPFTVISGDDLAQRLQKVLPVLQNNF